MIVANGTPSSTGNVYPRTKGADWEDAMQDAKTYRQYAADCARMAQKLNGEDRKILIRIADAWEQRALEAERQQKAKDKE